MIPSSQDGHPSFRRSVAVVALIGWTVAVPTIIGIAVGTWIDRTWPGRYSWTWMLLAGGLALGCRNAWIRIQHIREDH